jgi:hypothetical protein
MQSSKLHTKQCITNRQDKLMRALKISQLLTHEIENKAVKGVGSDSLVETSPFGAHKFDSLSVLLKDGVNHIMKCNAFCTILRMLWDFSNL